MTLAAASALALSVVAAPAALAQDDNPTPGYKPTSITIETVECGDPTDPRVVVHFNNPTDMTFSGDWRLGSENGRPDKWSDDEISEGPLKGKDFGPRYHKVTVPPGGATAEFDLRRTGEPQEVEAWIRRGPEQRAYSHAGPKMIEPCDVPVDQPSDEQGDKPGQDEDDTPPTNGDETTPPPGEEDTPADENDDTKTGGDDTATENGDDAKDSDDAQDDGVDEADEDGTAPTPEPQEAHIAVTG